MNYYYNDITCFRGDTFSHLILDEDSDQEFDNIYFTCRDSLNDDSNILFEVSTNNGITLIEHDTEKNIRKYLVRIDPSLTKNLQSGVYYYDEQVAINGDVVTIMHGKFIIKQDITRKTTTPPNPYELIDNYLDLINGEVI